MNRPLKILHLEDLPADAEMVARVLRKAKLQFDVKVVIGKPDFLKALREFQPDIILSDHSLPAFNSLEALKITREEGIVSPFILVTATVSEEYAVNVIKEGASDYVLKDRLERLPNAVQNALDRRRAEDELARQHDLQQKLIMETSIQVQEKEREQIGKELHDNINQILAAAKLYLDIATREDDESGYEAMEKCQRNLNLAMEEIRQLSQSLVAPSLGGMSLDQALRRLPDNFPLSASLKLNLDTTGYLEDIKDEGIKLTCYRIAQVQLNNIAKHARAKNAAIKLERVPDRLTLIIRDDGIGFNPEKKTVGIGLRNIRNRVNFYNGTVDLDSAPGKGCTLIITIPLPG
ncbi:MAG TPA: response regulator [Puia sp.]|jgi:two-component system sensor histidine kinase UhpB|nr:response regulator [Puia sp.]HEV3414587.1 response regulator [Puia sp.]